MSRPTEAMQAMDAGVTAADKPEDARVKADVARWFKRLKDAREYDKPAREQYARDRRYARGDSGHEVDANLIGTYIDIMESFMYARDPDVEVQPSRYCDPPSMDTLKDVVPGLVQQDPTMQQQIQTAGNQASWKALAQGQDPAQATKQAADMATEIATQMKFQQVRDRYMQRQRNMKQYAQTLELMVSYHWRCARLKVAGRRMVRSALSVGLGVLKISWQQRTAPSPETLQAINDLQDNIQRAAMLRASMDEASGAEHDAMTADYERQLTTLKGQTERIVASGLAIDMVPPEDFQIPPGYSLADHCNAPWNAHRILMLAEDARAEFNLDEETFKQAIRYKPCKPVMINRESALVVQDITDKEADGFETADAASGGDFVCLQEIWDRNTNTVLTGIEGIKVWVKPAWQPAATTRFFGFFVLPLSEVDAQRHPQSLVSRSARLIDEYNRIGSAEAEHRRRVLPGIIFNAGLVDEENAKKVEKSRAQEYTGIQPTNLEQDMRTLFVPKAYAPLDPALYARDRIVNELERIWGIQEALSGAVNVQKTLGEAEIQQSGFQARDNARRDLLETVLGEAGHYTAELLRAHQSEEDVVAIAGPDALWPPYAGAADLNGMVQVDIRAGSSGKPNTSAERQSWTQLLPLLQNGIQQIATLRRSTPEDVADSLEKLLRITAARAGDRIDVDSLLPKPGPQPMPGPQGAPADPNAPPQAGGDPGLSAPLSPLGDTAAPVNIQPG